MPWTIEAGKSCGPLSFGMSKAEVDAIVGAQPSASTWHDLMFDDDGLVALQGGADASVKLLIGGHNLHDMSRLDCALFLADTSTGPKQAQGGSLYFPDLCIAALQFESSARDFLIYTPRFDHGEPLRDITTAEITEYYEGQHS